MSKRDKRIEGLLDTIEDKMNKAAKKNQKYLEAGKFKVISEEWPFNDIGVYLLIGAMGSGKSYLLSKHILYTDALKLYSGVLYVTKNAKSDQTLETFASLSKNTPFIEVPQDDIVDVLRELLKRKKKYYAMYKAFMSHLKDINIEAARIFEKHRLPTTGKKKDLERTYKYMFDKFTKYGLGTYPIRTLICLDDAAGSELLKGNDSEFVQLLKQCRHFHIAVIICVQGSIDVKPDIKRIITDVVLYKTIPTHDIKTLATKITLPTDADELIDIHKNIKSKHGYIQINIIHNIVKIVDPN